MPDIYTAIHSNNEDQVKHFLALNTYEKTDTFGCTPLMVAAAENRLNMIKILLEHDKSNIDQITPSGQTALLCAIRRGHTDAVKLLLQSGASMDVSNARATALQEAVIFGKKIDMIEMLVKDYKADINQKNHKPPSMNPDETLLMRLMRLNNDSMVETLLQFENIDIYCVNDAGYTARDIAFKCGKVKYLRMLDEISLQDLNERKQETKADDAREKVLKELAENFIVVPVAQKSHLQQIQKQFSRPVLRDKCESEYAATHGAYFYSNDKRLVPGYFEATALTKSNKHKKTELFTLLDGLRLTPKKDTVGIVIGNGYVLSLLSQIPADDILLLDTEPVVHYFLLKARDLILNADTSQDFQVLRIEMIVKFEILEYQILSHNRNLRTKGMSMDEEKGVSNLRAEMQELGDKHFLSSKFQLEQCQKALQKKELLPVDINIFDDRQMERLASLLKQFSCQVSYINLSNVADYDEDLKLRTLLHKIPVSANSKIVLTALRSKDPKENKVFLCQNKKEVLRALEYCYISAGIAARRQQGLVDIGSRSGRP